MISPAKQSALNKTRYEWLPAPRVGLCRIRHDRECGTPRGNNQYAWLSRFYDQGLVKPRGLPEAVRYQGDKGNIALASQWQKFFADSNTPIAQSYLKRLQSGWVNYGPWPTVEQIGFGGDYVVVTKISGDTCYIESYDNSKYPVDYPEYDYLQNFSVVYTDDTVEAGSPVGPAYSFVIARPGVKLWIKAEQLTFVRSL